MDAENLGMPVHFLADVLEGAHHVARPPGAVRVEHAEAHEPTLGGDAAQHDRARRPPVDATSCPNFAAGRRIQYLFIDDDGVHPRLRRHAAGDDAGHVRSMAVGVGERRRSAAAGLLLDASVGLVGEVPVQTGHGRMEQCMRARLLDVPKVRVGVVDP